MGTSYNIAKLRVNAEAIISALPTTPTVKELMIAHKAAQGLNCSNQPTLEIKIQAAADAQTAATPDADVMMIALMIGSTQVQTLTTFATQTVTTSNASYPVPAGAQTCFVTCTSASYNNSGSRNGCTVTEYEIGVDGGGSGTINIVQGASHTIGNLQVNQGQYSDSGTVTFAGVAKPNSATVSNGTHIGGASYITLKFEIVTVV